MEYLHRFEGIDLGHKTLNRRFCLTLEQLASDPEASVNKACARPGQVKAAYRLLANEKLTDSAIVDTHHEVTLACIRESAEPVILVPQDTTEVNYSHLEHTSGLGSIGSDENLRGLLMHNALAVTPQGGVLGVLHQELWVRPPEEWGKKQTRKNRAIEDKESYRWLTTMERAASGDHGGALMVHLCDREGDIYEFFEKAAGEGHVFLCRRIHDRKTIEEDTIATFLDHQLPAGSYEVQIPRDSHTDRKERAAQLEIRYGQVQILRPERFGSHSKLEESLTVQVISAREIDAPEGVEAVNWQLITNLAVESFETAKQYIMWYSRRWLIETFHYTLKSGCTIEKLQSDTVERLRKLIEIYSIIAIRIMILTYLARVQPDDSCETILSPIEWKVLYCTVKRTKKPPALSPTILEAVIMIAQLGGFAGHKSSGFPGVKVLWWDLTKLMSILDALPFVGNFVG